MSDFDLASMPEQSIKSGMDYSRVWGMPGVMGHFWEGGSLVGGTFSKCSPPPKCPPCKAPPSQCHKR
eukprot:1157438-Pelagomonas_calceolata.AAC.8